MKKYVYFSMLFMFFTIFAIRLSIILSNKSFYEEKLEETKYLVYIMSGLSVLFGILIIVVAASKNKKHKKKDKEKNKKAPSKRT